MNNNFMFSPNLNPYADNAKYIKKSLNLRHFVFIALGIAVMLVCLVYAEIYTFHMASGNGTVFESRQNMAVQVLTFFVFGARVFYFIAALLVPCIGTVNFIQHLKDSESPILPNSLANTGSFFFVSCIVYNTIMFFFSIAQMGMTLISGDYDTINELKFDLGKIFFSDMLLSAVFVIWSISGLVFCSSVRNTLKCLALSDKGTTFFIVMSVIAAAFCCAVGMIYNVCGFESGIFYLSDGSTMLSDAIKRNAAAVVMFNLFCVASITVILNASFFAINYRLAVRAAQRSFSGYGSNLYMNGDSTAASYYQSYYTSPDSNGANPQATEPFGVNTVPQVAGNGDFLHIEFPKNNDGSIGLSENETVVCNICGAVNRPESEFCSGCGNDLRK